MKEHPIIFSGPMVKALLEGRKTQTRRLATSPLRRVEPGDKLWVREAWKPVHSADPSQGARYRIDAGRDDTKWRPSIHMPRWASRLTLAVTDVRFEWLRAITEQDAIAEGVERVGRGWRNYQGDGQHEFWRHATMSYGSLWSALHGVKSWMDDPLVVALTFTVEKS